MTCMDLKFGLLPSKAKPSTALPPSKPKNAKSSMTAPAAMAQLIAALVLLAGQPNASLVAAITDRAVVKFKVSAAPVRLRSTIWPKCKPRLRR